MQLTHEIAGTSRPTSSSKSGARTAAGPRRQAHAQEIQIRLAEPATAPRSTVSPRSRASTCRRELALRRADGHLTAALHLDDGRVLADPFMPTAAVRRVLELWAAQLTGRPGGLRRRLRLA